MWIFLFGERKHGESILLWDKVTQQLDANVFFGGIDEGIRWHSTLHGNCWIGDLFYLSAGVGFCGNPNL
ncbi:hypothetical protein KSF_109890 [Reticulibacter mediterranei]|uniref:Uncharacterized protein n=1 Tax=Reticulibacter mediterranei TaxID=2778369 RepID=A0A8J3J580_9CHLR|nr:hypothetical protein KSF_109890 [Reticulibacter mediterranei]